MFVNISSAVFNVGYNNELTVLVANMKQCSQREIRTAAEFVPFHYYLDFFFSLPQTLHPFILCSKKTVLSQSGRQFSKTHFS